MHYFVSTLLTVLLLLAPFPVYAAIFTPPGNRTIYQDRHTDWLYLIGFVFYSLWHWTTLALVLGFSGYLTFKPFLAATLSGYMLLLKDSFRQRAKNAALKLIENVQAYVSSDPNFVYVLLAQLCVLFYGGLTRTPQDYDTMAYHLPFIAEWILQGKFSLHPQFANNSIGYYPSAWEALTALFYFPFQNDTLFQLPGLIAYVLILLALSQLGLGLGGGESVCVYSPLLLGTFYITQKQLLSSLHVDLAFAAMIVTSVLFIRTASKSNWRYGFVIFILASCLALSIKSSAIYYIPILIGMVLLIEILSDRRFIVEAFGKFSLISWLLTCLGLAVGISWYVRNIFYTGNPLGTVALKIGSFTLFDGQRVDLWRTTLAHLFNPFLLNDYKILTKAFISMCGIPFLSLTAVSLFFSARMVKNKSVIFIWLLLAISFFLYWITPYSGDNGTNGWKLTPWIGQGIRYAYTFLAFCTTLIAFTMTSNRWSNLLISIVTLSVGFSFFSYSWLAWFVFGLYVFVLLSIFSFRYFQTKPLILTALIVLGVIGLIPVGSYVRIQKRPDWLASVYRVINENQIQNVAVLKTHRTFAAYGEDFKTKIRFVETAEQAIDLVRSKEVGGILYGPNTIPKKDSSSTFADLNSSPDISLAFDADPKKSPIFFVPK